MYLIVDQIFLPVDFKLNYIAIGYVTSNFVSQLILHLNASE